MSASPCTVRREKCHTIRNDGAVFLPPHTLAFLDVPKITPRVVAQQTYLAWFVRWRRIRKHETRRLENDMSLVLPGLWVSRGSLSMKEIQDRSKLNGDGSWPPPPDGQPQITAQSGTRAYAISGTSDTILGLLIGAASYCAALFAITNYILYYVIPHTVRSEWNFLDGALLALLIVFAVWLCLRSFYRRLANSFIIGAAVPAAAILYIVWVVW